LRTKTSLKGKNILITGGAGSVGKALIDKMLKHDPMVIRIFDISENGLYQVKREFENHINIRYLLGDIRDIKRVELAMEDIDIVVHLAAMKHVEVCEYNPFEATKTNIEGLQNVIHTAQEKNVERFIFSSTDKAVSPSSVMGMTKLLGERLISLANYYKGSKRTVFSSVRFGNVVGSSGSVVPLFRKQIKRGGPLTITDKNMTRFVITMQEAVDLIYSAIKLAKGGETFVWKMRPFKVIDLAGVMLEEYGSGKKIDIKIIGIGKGEKMYEEILTEEELLHTVELDNLYIISPLIDHLNVGRKYSSAKSIKNPVIISNKGSYLTITEIEKLLKVSSKV